MSEIESEVLLSNRVWTSIEPPPEPKTKWFISKQLKGKKWKH